VRVIPSKIAPRLCIECKHYKALACYRKAYTELSLVTGNTEVHNVLNAVKQRGNFFKCGSNGRFWCRTD